MKPRDERSPIREPGFEKGFLAAIIESSDDAMISMTLGGTILSWNAGAERLYGYAAAEAVGKHITFIDPPERRGEFGQIMEQIRRGKPLYNYETVRVKKDGRRLDISLRVSPIQESDGNIIGASVIARDIPERKRAEQELRQLATVVRDSNDAITLFDFEGRIGAWNRGAELMYGYSETEALRMNAFDIIPEHEKPEMQSITERVRTGEAVASLETQRRTKDGRLLDVWLTITAVLDEKGGPTGIATTERDITARKRRELELRMSKERLEERVAERTLKLHQLNNEMEHELNMAREMQLAMLPHRFPSIPPGVPSHESALRFLSFYKPSGRVSGDFFDLRPLSETAVGVLICDVMGHDVSAALVTAMIHALLEEFSAKTRDPGELLTQINRVLGRIFRHNGPAPVFSTAFYLVADVARSQMLYANAAHPSPLHLRRREGEVAPLVAPGKQGPAMGLFEKAAYESWESPIAPGDLVMLFTDGIFEVEDANQQQYGQDRLIAAVRQRLRVQPAELFKEVLQDVQQFGRGETFPDDICLVGMEVAESVKGK
jgi:sigma-B regulation protein RsbU (phosphoserine phosphatase)